MKLDNYITSPKGCLFVANDKIVCIHKGEYLGHVVLDENGRKKKNNVDDAVLFTHRIDFENDFCVFVKDLDEALIDEV